MTGIIIAQFKISDPESYKRYTARSAPAVKAAGGRYIAAGQPRATLEGGEHFNRVAVVEFDSVEQARRFYESAAYQEARRERQDGVEARMILLDGR